MGRLDLTGRRSPAPLLKLSKEITDSDWLRRPLLRPMLRRMGRRILVALSIRVNVAVSRVLIVGLLIASCTPESPSVAAFTDEAEPRGLVHLNRSGSAKKRAILEANGAGVALFDLEGDGDLDAVLAQGCASIEDLLLGEGADLAVFKSTGGEFKELQGPGLNGWWTGLASGDLDGDGDADLVAAGYGSLRVVFQGPEGALTPGPELLPAEQLIGASDAPSWCTSLALFDADRDGNLDLYVGRYLDLNPNAIPTGTLGEGALAVACQWKGLEVYCGPRGLAAQPDLLLMGNGDGSFRDESNRLLGERTGYTLSVLPLDADGDGDTDIAVACDSSPNKLWISDGAGSFTDFAYEAGFALSMDGRPEAGMGLASGDVNGDGRLDLAITNFSDEPTRLLFGAKVGYDDVSYRYGLNSGSRALLSWGAHLTDFDGDGYLELFTTNGHVYPQADEELTGTQYAQRDTLWSLGPERHAAPVDPSGERSLLALERGTRGSAVGDIDGDGRPDLLISAIDAPAILGINNSGLESSRLCLRLLGPSKVTKESPRTPRDGTGARCVVVIGEGAAERALLSESYTATGYQSASSPWLYFGMGSEEEFQSIRIQWPSGAVEELAGGPASRRLWIREGEGVIKEEPLQ